MAVILTYISVLCERYGCLCTHYFRALKPLIFLLAV